MLRSRCNAIPTCDNSLDQHLVADSPAFCRGSVARHSRASRPLKAENRKLKTSIFPRVRHFLPELLERPRLMKIGAVVVVVTLQALLFGHAAGQRQSHRLA